MKIKIWVATSHGNILYAHSCRGRVNDYVLTAPGAWGLSLMSGTFVSDPIKKKKSATKRSKP